MKAFPFIAVLLVAAPLLAFDAQANFHEPLGTIPDRDFALIMRGTSFNGMTHTDTPLLEAFVGEKVRFTVVVPPLAEAHTFHLHGHPWLIPETGRVVDTVLMKPGEIHSFVVIAGGVGHEAGDWMYHCHIDQHAAFGMWGIFRVYPFSVELRDTPNGLIVKTHRMGEPVDDADFTLTLNGRPIDAHVRPLGQGEHLVHATIGPATTGELAVHANSAWGESVARKTLGDAPGPAASVDTVPHAVHAALSTH